jgi:hypothetical protein
MARPKRMGAYNALDDLLPGGVWGKPEGSPRGTGPAWDPGDPGPAWDPDDPGPAWDPGDPGPGDLAGEPALPPRRARLEPVPDPAPVRRRARDRHRGANALDDLLPGPRGVGGMDDLLPGPSAPAPSGRRLGPGSRPRRGGRHLGVWNPLDGPPPAAPEPAPVPAKARVSFRLPADLVETARDAVAHLAGTAEPTTLTALAERALRVELARLAITHNHGRPFPPREP